MRNENPNRNKQILQLFNKIFLIVDPILTVAFLLLLFIFIPNRCLCLSFLIYSILYSVQSLQHYLLYKFPLIDINKHHVAYRRLVIFICLIDVGYLFMNVTFYQKSELHPLYCVLCVQGKLGLWIGLVFILHQIVLVAWGIVLIHGYITRRYYLLALGGFEVQQRIRDERARQLRDMLVIQPDINTYPLQKQDKYYKFEDVVEVEEENYQCTICMNNKVDDDHFVNPGCGHYYHQVCLLQWAQVNSNCPQCRRNFQQMKNSDKQVLQKKPDESCGEYNNFENEHQLEDINCQQNIKQHDKNIPKQHKQQQQKQCNKQSQKQTKSSVEQ